MMSYQQFLQRIQWVGHFDSVRQAEKASKAVLKTLARRLSEQEARHLWHQLPPGIEISVKHEKGHEKFGVDEFFDMVAEQERVTFKEAINHSEAVLGALQENIPSKDMEEMLSFLPEDYATLLSRARDLALASR
ncbi:MAG: DUF2267 domain-containing protein [Nitrospiraceae bacterium]|nr:DUF2267 domain-containing protein [Nitrospiraceae bacterium]